MNLLNESSDFKTITRKGNTVNDQSITSYDVGNEIIYNTEVLKCNLNDHNGSYNLRRGDVDIIGRNFATKVTFKKLCFIHYVYHKNWWNSKRWCWRLRFGYPMYNLLEHSSSYSDATDSLQFYSKDEANNFNANIEDNSAFKPFSIKLNY